MSYRRLKKRAGELGVRISEDEYVIYADAPRGKRFAVGERTLSRSYKNPARQSWKDRASRDILDEMEYGLEDDDDIDL